MVSTVMIRICSASILRITFLQANDDQFAQQALFVTLYHWGFHAWGCYILVALTLAFVAHRWDMPMTLRNAFYPLLGDVVNGLLGDFIGILSACTWAA